MFWVIPTFKYSKACHSIGKWPTNTAGPFKCAIIRNLHRIGWPRAWQKGQDDIHNSFFVTTQYTQKKPEGSTHCKINSVSKLYNLMRIQHQHFCIMSLYSSNCRWRVTSPERLNYFRNCYQLNKIIIILNNVPLSNVKIYINLIN